MANRILLDLGPLRERPDFRRLFAGQLMAVIGGQLLMVAIAFEVYTSTGSSLRVGAVSLAQVVPLVLGALVGGSVGGTVDRRRLLATTMSLLGATSGVLALNATASHPSLVVIYLVSALAAGVGGVASTACNAAVPALVEPHHLVAAYASMQVVDQVAMVVAPALSGLLLAAIGFAWVYALVALAYVGTALVMRTMSAVPRATGVTATGPSALRAGLRLLRGRPEMQGAFLIDLNAMLLGMPRALFPALAVGVFHGGADALGYLYAAPGVGALAGALTTGWLAGVRHQARVVIVAVCVWGAAIAAFGLTHVLWLALVLLGVAGWADVISAVLRSAIVQGSTHESFRDRISSLQIAVVEGGPRLGDLEAGVVANLVSTEFSVIAGGLACIAGALALAGLLPGFRRYTRPPDPAGLRRPAKPPSGASPPCEVP